MKKFAFLFCVCMLCSMLQVQAFGMLVPEMSDEGGRQAGDSTGVVPGWVKELTSPTEYALWEELSKNFKVDYSILRKTLSAEQRGLLYEYMAKICEQIENHTYPFELGGILVFSVPEPIDTLLDWDICEYKQIDENLSYREFEGIVFRAAACPEAQVKVKVWCVYDKAKNDMHIIKNDMQAARKGVGGDGSVVVRYDEGKRMLLGSCAGSLRYLDPSNVLQSADFNKSYCIAIE